jgi:hypothetical protein
MEPTKQLIDAIYRDRVLSARKTAPEVKLRASLELDEYACGLMRDGIRNQFPDADEQRVEEIVRQRLALARRLRNPHNSQ